MSIGNGVNVSFNHANFDNVLWSMEIMISSNKVVKMCQIWTATNLESSGFFYEGS